MRKLYICPFCKVEQMATNETIMNLGILRGSISGNSASKTFDDPEFVF